MAQASHLEQRAQDQGYEAAACGWNNESHYNISGTHKCLSETSQPGQGVIERLYPTVRLLGGKNIVRNIR